MKPRYLQTSLFLILIIISLDCVSQGWHRTYGTGTDNWGADVIQTNDGGYIVIGNRFDAIGSSIYVVKTDVTGDTLWSSVQAGLGTSDCAFTTSLMATANGEVIILGTTRLLGTNSDSTNNYLMKLNANGELIWGQTYGGQFEDRSGGVISTADSGFAIVCSKSQGTTAAGPYDVSLIKTDSDGNEIWSVVYGDSTGFGRTIEQTSDGGYLLGGQTDLWGSGWTAGTSDYLLIKTDSNGNELWRNTYGTVANDETLQDIQATSDGGFLLIGICNGCANSAIIKIDSLGNELWSDSTTSWLYNIQTTTDGGYILAGFSYNGSNNNVILEKMDSNWNSLWTKNYGGNNDSYGYAVEQTSDDGFIVTGWTFNNTSPNIFDYIYLIKTDSLGNIITNFISGNVFHDLNADCVQDTLEASLAGWLVRADPGPVYTTTNEDGYYSFFADTGTYTITEFAPNSLWSQNCPVGPDTYTGNFTVFYDTLYGANFGNQIAINCPNLWVDISTWAIRPCQNSIYTVNYCNTGTASIDSVYIEVDFNNMITPVSSTLPWSAQTGNMSTFFIDSLVVGQCGSFQITAAVSCNAIMGSTQCIEARIYPDTNCLPLDPASDKSSVAVEGWCEGDTLVCFTIWNTGDFGSGDMQATSDYRIYENNVLIYSGTFQLVGQDSIIVCWPANGNTIRLEADQRPGHPGNSHPQDNVELCSNPNNVMGQIALLPEDDNDDNKEVDCRVVTGPVDPNEKLVKPVGLTNNHYIDTTDVLEYQINFQNTGTDTSIHVYIIDTLSQILDVVSVVSGASSYPYTFKIYGPGIMQWTFNNIYLPDSNINEPASHGFVKFKVKQKPNLASGTLIENSAGIIFDFNAPVITNTAWNIIYDTMLVTQYDPLIIYNKHDKIRIYPNPNKGVFNVVSASGEIRVYDVYGRLVLSTIKPKIDLSDKPKGIYVVRVGDAVGKVVIH